MASHAMLQAVPASGAQHEGALARARTLLAEAAMTADASAPQALAGLDGLADQLLDMRARGFSNEKLCLLLGEGGIAVSAVDLGEYLQSRMLSHVVARSSAPVEGQVGTTLRASFIESSLRRALDTGVGLTLHYQPQVNMATGAMVGAEALLRWNNGNDFVSPTEFIPVAEQSDLIERLGEWVLRTAAADAASWMRAGVADGQGIKVAVNVSVKQLGERLQGIVHSALCDAGLPAHLMTLEITESQLADEATLQHLSDLRDTGLHVAVDDFGTGYSSLARLNRLPLDIIKIDREFVQDLGRAPGAAAVVEAIVDLANKMGIRLVAEGVETELQAALLQSIGCSTAQGYLYARPMTADAFFKFARGAQA